MQKKTAKESQVDTRRDNVKTGRRLQLPFLDELRIGSNQHQHIESDGPEESTRVRRELQLQTWTIIFKFVSASIVLWRFVFLYVNMLTYLYTLFLSCRRLPGKDDSK